MDYEGTLEVTFLLAALIRSVVSPTDSNETINVRIIFKFYKPYKGWDSV